MIIGFRKAASTHHSPLIIGGFVVERVHSTKFLRTHLKDDLTSKHNTKVVGRKAQQHLSLLRRLKRAGLSKSPVTVFYRITIQSVLTYCITSWYGNNGAEERQRLSRVIRTERIIGVPLSLLSEIYSQRCTHRGRCIIRDPSHPSHSLFSLMPAGRQNRSIWTRTSQPRNSFFPTAIRLLNEHGK